MIKDFVPRLYQETIFSTCALKNTLVVLPTGLGKTNIFLMLSAQRLAQYPDSKILFIGPTKPLIHQYFDVFIKHFEIEPNKLAIFTGQVSPQKRESLWLASTIIFSTPQGLENDIISRRIKLDEVSLLGIDEAHRAVKDYSYVWIAKEYVKKAKFPRILGLTASPGSDAETINEVCKNLQIEDIEVRTNTDPDVKPYIKEIALTYVEVELDPEFKKVKHFLEESYQSKLSELKNLGVVGQLEIKKISKRELLGMQLTLISEINAGNKAFEVLKSLSLLAEVMKLSHAIELLESQGTFALNEYFQKLLRESKTSRVKAAQNLVRDNNFKSACILTERLIEENKEHPKFAKLTEIIKDKLAKEVKIIVFTQYRDTAKKISEVISKIEGASPKIFVGQQKKADTGMSQKQQIEMLNHFRDGLFNIIIMTSVGEEGLDIPSVDLVIFFEPVPSVIRHIQRRGRTGRQEKGSVMVLTAKGTRDEVYRWSTKHKEKRMYDAIKTMKKDIFLNPVQKELQSFSPNDSQEIKIITDYREKGSAVIKELINQEIHIQLEQLKTADYLVSERVGIEYKTADDFIASIIDGRLLDQLKELRRNFERPIIIIEGDRDIYTLRNIHPNAIKGMIATIIISYGIPIIYTKNSKETADLLIIMAKREQEGGNGNYSMHGTKKPFTLTEQQEYAISSLPNIGPNLAKELLKEFKTIKNFVNASESELMKVDKVGTKIAKRVREVLDEPYKPN